MATFGTKHREQQTPVHCGKVVGDQPSELLACKHSGEPQPLLQQAH